jgi:Protein of unknown function (DUF2955)
MSADAATLQTHAEEAGEAHALAFRIAFVAAVGLTLGEVLGWDFPFLPAMLAVQLLSAGGPISLKQGFAFVAVMVVTSAFAVLISQLLVDSPLVLLLVIALSIFLAFLLLARGQAVGVAATFLITNAVIPLLAIESLSLAYGFVYTLIAGSVLAVLLSFAAYALFPSSTHAEPAALQQPEERAPTAAALANTAALMSLVIYFMLSVSPVSVVAVLTVINILRQPASAIGLVLGNLVGGLAATAAYLLVTLLPSPAFLLLVALLVGLILGARIARGGEQAPIYTVSLMTFLIVLGLGLSPLPQDSADIFISRVFDVMVAAVYGVGMASLLRAAFRAR